MERAAPARSAFQPHASIHLFNQARADRQAQAGASVFTRHGSICLGESAKDGLLLVCGNADSRIADRKMQYGFIAGG